MKQPETAPQELPRMSDLMFQLEQALANAHATLSRHQDGSIDGAWDGPTDRAVIAQVEEAWNALVNWNREALSSADTEAPPTRKDGDMVPSGAGDPCDLGAAAGLERNFKDSPYFEPIKRALGELGLSAPRDYRAAYIARAVEEVTSAGVVADSAGRTLWPYIPDRASIEGEGGCGAQVSAFSQTFTCTLRENHQGAHQGELWWR